jgi:hypothetical protein
VKLAVVYMHVYATTLKYRLISRALDTWADTFRYCLIVAVTTCAPIGATWFLLRGR